MTVKTTLSLLALFSASALYAQNTLRVENTNFTLSQASYIPGEDERYLYNNNRLRGYWEWSEGNFFLKATGDLLNYLGEDFTQSDSFSYIELLHSDTPMKTQSSFRHYTNGAVGAKMYRLYGGYQDDKNRVVLGLQNITMGVGHIWTPSNLFNPTNTYALEPDETFGVMALSYTHYLNDKSQVYAVVSQREDKSAKYAAGYKNSFGTVDVALNAIHSNDTQMLAYAIEGDLGESGIEVRSEGAYIQSDIMTLDGSSEEKKFFQGIVGADYGFQSGVNLTVEALYSSETFRYDEVLANINKELSGNLVMSHFYLGSTLSYDFTIYLSASLLYIESFNDENSRFVSPSLTYTINDNNTLSAGALIYGGSDNSEFGMWKNSYYLKYVLSF